MKIVHLGLILLGLIVLGQAGGSYSYYSDAENPMQLTVSNQFAIGNGNIGYKLSCAGYEKGMTYTAEGLPEGAQIKVDKIVISANTKAGNYNIILKGTDSATGQTVQQKFGLTIERIDIGDGQTAIATNARLDQVLRVYSAPVPYTLPNYPGNRYPTIDAPTGRNPDSANFDIPSILNDAAAPSNTNRNPISQNDVQLRAASERYQNAVKSITNILTIIDQARANKFKAQNNLNGFTQAYNAAVNKQKEAQNAIIAAESKMSQIESAIKEAQNSLNEIKKKNEDLGALIKDQQNQRAKILEDVQKNESKRAELLDVLKKLDTKLSVLVDNLREQEEACKKLEDERQRVTAILDKRRSETALVKKKIIASEKDIAEKQALVINLRNQLTAAENDLSNAKINLSNIKDEESKLPGIINGLEILLADLVKQIPSCEAVLKNVRDQINGFKSDPTTANTEKQVEEITTIILQQRNQASGLDAAISSNQAKLDDLKAQFTEIDGTVKFLKGELNNANEALRKLYGAGNDANTAVAFARQNLEAVTQRYEREAQVENQATLNLERARAEEALSKLGLDEVIAKYSNALPYAIVPHGNGIGAGAPTGNNAAGSPLGPATLGADVIQIRDWTHYLSSAFGNGINPNFDRNINSLYPIENTFATGLRNGNDGVCNKAGSNNTRSLTGTVSNIGNSYFDIKTNNGLSYRLNVSPCSKLYSNIEDHHIEYGDKIVAKGTQSAGNNFNCEHAIALT